MNRNILASGLCCLTLVLASCSSPAVPIQAKTSEAKLVETSSNGTMFAMTKAEFEKKVGGLRKPAGLTLAARFGMNLTIERQKRDWILDGDLKTGYTLYADMNGNGDLSDDGARKFEVEDGKPTLRFRDGAIFKLVVDRVVPPGQTDKQLAVIRYATTRRTGEFAMPSRKKPLPFRITGMNGVYNANHLPISFDFDNDGKFDTEIERYVMSEKHVNIDGLSYAFVVDERGESVTLTPLAERRPDRAILKTGFPAPDFQFVDLEGQTRRLSDFRGKVVLLDFWGIWCPSCVQMAPELVRLYEAYHARGFEIIGIASNDPREKVAAFIAERRMPWTQTLESDKGPIATLYRVNGWPTSFLVGPDGKFLAATYLGEVDVRGELEKLWGEVPSSGF
jgi:peroxiredoxin